MALLFSIRYPKPVPFDLKIGRHRGSSRVYFSRIPREAFSFLPFFFSVFINLQLLLPQYTKYIQQLNTLRTFDCLRRWKVSRKLATFKLVRRLVNSGDSSLIVKVCIRNTISRNFERIYIQIEEFRFLFKLASKNFKFLPPQISSKRNLARFNFSIPKLTSYTLSGGGLVRIAEWTTWRQLTNDQNGLRGRCNSCAKTVASNPFLWS